MPRQLVHCQLRICLLASIQLPTISRALTVIRNLIILGIASCVLQTSDAIAADSRYVTCNALGTKCSGPRFDLIRQFFVVKKNIGGVDRRVLVVDAPFAISNTVPPEAGKFACNTFQGGSTLKMIDTDVVFDDTVQALRSAFAASNNISLTIEIDDAETDCIISNIRLGG